MQFGAPFYEQVLPGIGITNVLSASEIDRVVEHGYTACLNASEFDFADDARDRVAYRWIPLVDGAGNDIEEFVEAVETLHRFRRDGHATLVNCYAGVSRSASIVAVYMVRFEPENLERLAAERLASPGPLSFRLLHGHAEGTPPDLFADLPFKDDPLFQSLWTAFQCIACVRPVVYLRPAMWADLFPRLRPYLASPPSPG
ncbi:MAG: dual specificity protein phosphatase family protein [Candidatus Sumerlaeia bacterium]|nr:dual specificity protein phosphatase family protein [Candidatus Sumerlaeia bacterium]